MTQETCQALASDLSVGQAPLTSSVMTTQTTIYNLGLFGSKKKDTGIFLALNHKTKMRENVIKATVNI